MRFVYTLLACLLCSSAYAGSYESRFDKLIQENHVVKDVRIVFDDIHTVKRNDIPSTKLVCRKGCMSGKVFIIPVRNGNTTEEFWSADKYWSLPVTTASSHDVIIYDDTRQIVGHTDMNYYWEKHDVARQNSSPVITDEMLREETRTLLKRMGKEK